MSATSTEDDHRYIVGTGASAGGLPLSEFEERRVERAPIDHFLRTLAATHDGHAIGIILTGSGSDGALGIRQVKESGALTIARESGVAMSKLDEAARGSGYGRELITRALPYQLNAKTTFTFGADGVRCTTAISVPRVPPCQSDVLSRESVG